MDKSMDRLVDGWMDERMSRGMEGGMELVGKTCISYLPAFPVRVKVRTSPRLTFRPAYNRLLLDATSRVTALILFSAFTPLS